MLDEAAQLRRQVLPAADDARLHVGAGELGQILLDEMLEQPHQEADFGMGPTPVLGREAVERQHRDAEITGIAHRTPQRFQPAPVAFLPRQTAHLRPAAVSIHDDGDMVGGRSPRIALAR